MSAAPGGRRVLVLSYFFPPLGGAGVQRTLKHVKYLPAAGWAPTVVTTRSTWYPARDPSLARDIPPGTPVLRAADPGALRLATMAASRAGALAQLTGWPDEAAAWIPAAVRAAVRAARRERFDALYSSSAPLSSHLAALAVQRRTGLPWVADFRDEWAENPYARRIAPVAALTRRAERAVRDRAEAVVVAAEHYVIGGRGPDDPKRVTITNGADPDDVPDLAPAPRNERMRLVFTGTLYGDIDLRPVLEGLARLAAAGRIDPARVELRIAGNIWVPALASAGAVEVVRLGYVDHARAVREMASADVLVAHVDPSSRNTPAKIFEYLASGRPVLSATHPESLSHRLVAELGAGWAVDPRDGAGVERAIEDAYRRWTAGDLPTRPAVREEALRRHGRDALARELAAVLGRVAGA
jgi:glycosyltransferase involved in cell wall biosynthesis